MTANTAIAEAYRSETDFSMYGRELLSLWVFGTILALAGIATLVVAATASPLWLAAIGLLAAFAGAGVAFSYLVKAAQ